MGLVGFGVIGYFIRSDKIRVIVGKGLFGRKDLIERLGEVFLGSW